MGIAVLVMGTLVGCGKENTKSLAKQWNAKEADDSKANAKEKPFELTGKVIESGDVFKIYDSGILEIIGEYSLEEDDMTEEIVDDILEYDFDKVYVSGEKLRYFPELQGKSYELYIDKDVKNIASDTFKENTQITKLVVYSEEIEIEDDAFLGCAELREVKLQGDTIKIGSNVFKNCTKLKNVYLSDTIENISDGSFEGCISLENVKMPKNLVKIGKRAFKYCCELENIEIPKAVEKLPDGAFEGCVSLSKVVMDSSLSKYEEDGYFGEEVTIKYN